MQWFRLYTEFLSDPVIKLLSFEDQRHFVAALCMKAMGVLDKDYPSVTLRNRVISSLVGLSDQPSESGQPSALDLARNRLQEMGLVEADWQPVNWEKRQYKSDHSDPTAAERMRRHREKSRNERNATDDVTNVTCNVTALEQNRTDTEKIGQPPSAFDLFWSVYPKKVKRKTTAEIWNRKRLDSKSGELVTDVQRRIDSDQRWRKGFIPDPTTYLNQERWRDELSVAKRPRVEGL